VSHAYYPGLQACEWTLLRRERLLPVEGEVLVREGQAVAPDTVVAQTSLRGQVVPVNVAASLGLAPEEVPTALVREVGATVAANEVIARTRGMFGLLRSECRAPVAGTLASASAATGQVMIEGPPVAVQVRAWVSGTVAEVRPGRGAVIAAGGSWLQGIFGLGGEAWGPLVLAVPTPVETLGEKDITPAMRGKVIVGGALARLDALRRAAQVGVAGLITGGVHALDVRDLTGEELGVAVTGNEELGFTLVVTEGFGQIAMARRTFRLLGEREGFVASVTGATQIRAGVLRPEILVPAPAGERPPAEPPAGDGIALGSAVRLIRAPHFGAIGRVVALPAVPQVVASGSSVRVLVAELENGLRVTVPRSNVEIF